MKFAIFFFLPLSVEKGKKLFLAREGDSIMRNGFWFRAPKPEQCRKHSHQLCIRQRTQRTRTRRSSRNPCCPQDLKLASVQFGSVQLTAWQIRRISCGFQAFHLPCKRRDKPPPPPPPRPQTALVEFNLL